MVAEPGFEAHASQPVGTGRRRKRSAKPRRRPGIITALAVWMIVAGAASLLGAVTAIGLDAVWRIGLLSVETAEKITVDQNALTVTGLLLLAGAVVDMVVGIGALRLKPWAWTLGVAVTAFDIATRLWTLTVDDFSWPVAIGASMAVVVLFYLQQDDVKRAFGR